MDLTIIVAETWRQTSNKNGCVTCAIPTWLRVTEFLYVLVSYHGDPLMPPEQEMFLTFSFMTNKQGFNIQLQHLPRDIFEA